MPIMLTPDQITKNWDIIKFAAISVDYVQEKYRERYLNRLLYMLLSNKAQCFFKLDDERKVVWVGITRIEQDHVTDSKILFLANLFAYQKVPLEEWQKDYEFIKAFAIKSGCNLITTHVALDRSAHLCESVGMTYRYKAYELEV